VKNVTITLSDELARRARVEAAQADKSLSRYIADLLAERVVRKPRRPNLQREAIERFLGAPDIQGFEGSGRPLRDHIYADLRGHQSDRVQSRSTRRRKAG
jgi:hypothetical protein